MKFKTVVESEVVSYLASIPEVASRFSDFSELVVEEIGDGNLNFVYRVTSRRTPSETVILKQAVPYLRVVGESWPLTRHRMDIEVAALRHFAGIAPGHVPEVFYADLDMSVVVMRNLREHRILRGGLIEGMPYPNLADHLSTVLARGMFFSSDLYLPPDQKRAAVKQFTNVELCKITEDLIFTHPYDDSNTNAYHAELPVVAIDRIQRNPPLRAAVAEMKYAFMTKAEALLHGDLHTGSVMVNEKETFVIDPEFAFYGPMGFDLGVLLANFFLGYCAQDARGREQGRDGGVQGEWMLDCAARIWRQFESKFLTLWSEHEWTLSATGGFIGRDLDGVSLSIYQMGFMRRLLAETLGFAACEMMRRTVGLAKVADVAGIVDADARRDAEVRSLRFAEHLILHRDQWRSLEEVLLLLKSPFKL